MSLQLFLQSVCVQTAVYWGTPTPDGYGGFTFADPIEVKCRWDDKTQMVVDFKGKEVVSKAQLIVLDDLDLQGLLYLGSLDDLDSTEETDPSTVEGAYEIIRIEKNPEFASTTDFIRQVFL